jgi:tetratricopeptide (TPR) repeat protein
MVEAEEAMTADLVERLREEYSRAPADFHAEPLLLEAADEIERLRDALERILADIADYERVNNLAPNPGRQYCWDSVAHAHAILEKPADEIERLRAMIGKDDPEKIANAALHQRGEMMDEIERLREALATCRELREIDKALIAKLRAPLTAGHNADD